VQCRDVQRRAVRPRLRRCSLGKKALGSLAKAIKAVNHAIHRQKPVIPLECAAALRSMLSDGRSRVQAEIASSYRHRRH
jgi:hypothetical protein